MASFSVLGPLLAEREGELVELGGRRQRLVLALLVLHSPEPVSADRLIEDVWGETPPPKLRQKRCSPTCRGCGRLSATAFSRRRPPGIGSSEEPTLLEFEPDFPAPGSVLDHLIETGFSASDGLTAATTSRYSSPELDRRLRRAAKLQGEARLRAYAQLDADIARNIAPLIPVGTVAQLDTFSERTGCQRYNTRAGIVLGALCLDRRAG